MNKLNAADIVHLTSKYTVARMLERDDFSKRYKSQTPIGIHEFLYPLTQGYDSVALKADVELGGTDQKFNLLVGRELQRDYGQEPQVIMTVPLLEGTCGIQKMSKSLNNAIGLTEPPKDIFGKIMSISDKHMLRFYLLLTDKTEKDIQQLKNEIDSGKLHPKKAKVELAKEMITRYYDKAAADQAAQDFEAVFAKGALPENLETQDIAAKEAPHLCALLTKVGFTKSNSEARRKINEGAVKIAGKKETDINRGFNSGESFVLQLGKRNIKNITIV